MPSEVGIQTWKVEGSNMADRFRNERFVTHKTTWCCTACVSERFSASVFRNMLFLVNIIIISSSWPGHLKQQVAKKSGNI